MMEKRASARFTAVIFSLTGLMLLFVWAHSLLPADLSSQESEGLLELLYRFFGMFGTGREEAHALLRKIAHFSEFAATGGLLLSCGYCFDRQMPYRYTVPVLFAGLAAAVIDETIQLFSEGRAGMITDVWIDFGGVVCGSLLMLGAYTLHRRRRMKKRGGKPHG